MRVGLADLGRVSGARRTGNRRRIAARRLFLWAAALFLTVRRNAADGLTVAGGEEQGGPLLLEDTLHVARMREPGRVMGHDVVVGVERVGKVVPGAAGDDRPDAVIGCG